MRDIKGFFSKKLTNFIRNTKKHIIRTLDNYKKELKTLTMTDVKKVFLQKCKNSNIYFLLSFLLILSVYLIKCDLLLSGNGFYESGAVFFKTAYYFNNITDAYSTLDNGYLPWLATSIALIVNKLFGATENFFIVSQLLVGIFLALGTASICLKYFDTLISDIVVRFSVSIFIGVCLLLTGRYGDFTFLHNAAYGLVFFAIITFANVSFKELSVSSKYTMLLFFFLIFINSKPYFVIFSPIAIASIIYALYISKSRKIALFYFITFLFAMIQTRMIIMNQGNGLSQIVIEGYNIFLAITDTLIYWLSTYSFFLFGRLLPYIDNTFIYNIVTITVVLAFLPFYIFEMWKEKNYNRLFLLFLLNSLALGSLFITLYGCTGLLHFPRMVLSLNGIIPIENSRHFLISNMTVIISLVVVLCDIINRILSKFQKRIVILNCQRVATITILLLMSTSGIFSSSWLVPYNTNYLVYHSQAMWKNDYNRYINNNKEKSFLILNNTDPMDFGLISDISKGYYWLNFNIEVFTPINNPKKQHLIPHNLFNAKINGFIIIPNQMDFILGVDTDNIDFSCQKNTSLINNHLSMIRKDFVVWTTKSNNELFLFKEEYKYKPIHQKQHKIRIDKLHRQNPYVRIYYAPSDKPYILNLLSDNEEVLLSKELPRISYYNEFKTQYFLPALRLLTGEYSKKPSEYLEPISWVDVDISNLKDFNGLVTFTPKTKNASEKSEITIFTHENGSLFVRNDDNIYYAIAYDKNGKVIGRADIIHERLKSPYKYLNFGDLLENVHAIKLFDNNDKEVLIKHNFLFFGIN